MCCPEIGSGHPAHTSPGARGGPVRVLPVLFPLEIVDAPMLWVRIKLLAPGADSERTKRFLRRGFVPNFSRIAPGGAKQDLMLRGKVPRKTPGAQRQSPGLCHQHEKCC